MTNIPSLPSTRPVNGSIEVKILTYDGYMIEEQLTGLPIQPNKVAVLDVNTLGISPNYFETNSSANYTMVFKPLNFEQNMTVHIAVPASIGIPDKPVCRGLQGTDTTNLNCTRTNHTITIHDAWLERT